MSTLIYHQKYSAFSSPFDFRSSSNSLLINGIVTLLKLECVYMNDDTPEVDSFSHECYQALSAPSVSGEGL